MLRFLGKLQSQQTPAIADRVLLASPLLSREYGESAWQGSPPPYRSMTSIIDKTLTYCERHKIEPHIAPPREDVPRKKSVVHPSATGGCARSVALEMLRSPEALPSPYRKPSVVELARICACGHASHRRIQGYFFEAKKQSIGSVTRVWEDIVVRIPSLLVFGEADMIVEIAGKYRYLLEIKTIVRSLYKEMKAPKLAWVWQSYLYMKALGLKATVVVLECRDNCAHKDFYIEWDNEVWEEIKSWILDVLRSLQCKELPEANTKHCHFCDYKPLCDAKGGDPRLVPWKNRKYINFPDNLGKVA